MKKTTFFFAGILSMLSMAGCTGTGTTNSSDSTSTTTQMNPGDSAVTTTTTTTTTHHRYTGNFVPKPTTQYYDLQTKKQIKVQIDTIRGTVVNVETQEPVDLFVEPTTHDTIYGKTGTVVNNYIIKDESGYRVDTVRINTNTNTVEQAPAPEPEAPSAPTEGKTKTKTKNNGEKTKEKTK